MLHPGPHCVPGAQTQKLPPGLLALFATKAALAGLLETKSRLPLLTSVELVVPPLQLEALTGQRLLMPVLLLTADGTWSTIGTVAKLAIPLAWAAAIESPPMVIPAAG